MNDFSISPSGKERHPAIVELFRREAEEYEILTRLDLSAITELEACDLPQPAYYDHPAENKPALPYLLAAAQMHADEKLIGEGQTPVHAGDPWLYGSLAFHVPWLGNHGTTSDTDRWRACWGSESQMSSDRFPEYCHLDAEELLSAKLQTLASMRIEITERQQQLGIKNQDHMTVGALLNHAWYTYTKPWGPDRAEPQASWPKVRKVRYPVDHHPSHTWELADANEARKLLQLLADVANHIFIDLIRSRRKVLKNSSSDIDTLYRNTANLGAWIKYLHDLDIPNLSDQAALALTKESDVRTGFGPAGALSKDGGQLTPDRVVLHSQ